MNKLTSHYSTALQTEKPIDKRNEKLKERENGIKGDNPCSKYPERCTLHNYGTVSRIDMTAHHFFA